MSERFFLETAPRDGVASLSGDEARHLARVLRAKVGDAVRVFDGRGSEWSATVLEIGRGRVDLAVGEPIRAGEAGLPLSLAVALPKGDRQRWLVEKLTELGAARLVPLSTDRGVAEATPAAVERLRRGVIEACKQCGRSTLMEIAEPTTVANFLSRKLSTSTGLLAEATGPTIGGKLRSIEGELLALVGPEGGFTDRERAAAIEAGFAPVSLGAYILRVETAAVAIAAAAAASAR